MAVKRPDVDILAHPTGRLLGSRAPDDGTPEADTHALANPDHLELGLGIARRARLGPGQGLNARPLADLRAWTERAPAKGALACR